MASSDLNLPSVGFQSSIRSKIIRQNFSNIQNEFNALRAEVSATIASTASEITSARDGFGTLQDNIHTRYIFENFHATGGVVTAQGTPDNTVNVSAGEAIVNGVGCDWAASLSNTISTASTPRFDVVTINSDNTLSVELGNTGGTAILPDLSTTQRPLYLISQDTASPLTIETGDLTDIRQQGAYVNGQYFFKIQDAIDHISEGTIHVKSGRYYEELDLSGKSNIEIKADNGAEVYRINASNYALTSNNSVSNETTGIKISGLSFKGNGKAGNIPSVLFNYTDNFIMENCTFDGNTASTASEPDFHIRNCDNFRLDKNIIDDYATTLIQTGTGYFEDGYFKGQVVQAGTNAVKAELTKKGFTELTAAANRFVRAESSAGVTGGTDDSSHTHSHTHTMDSAGSVGSRSIANDVVKDGGKLQVPGAGGSSFDVASDTTDTDATGASATDNKPAYYSLILMEHR